MSKVSIGIVGGGFSGVATAYQLAKQLTQRHDSLTWWQKWRRPEVEIVVYEPARIGGRAYGGRSKIHHTNLSHEWMSIDPDDPDHAVRFARARGWMQQPGEGVLRHRQGIYIKEALRLQREAARKAGVKIKFRKVRGVAQNVALDSGARAQTRFSVKRRFLWGLFRTSESCRHDIAVLATGHAPVELPENLAMVANAVQAGGVYVCRDLWADRGRGSEESSYARQRRFFERAKGAHAVVVGSGLSADDYVITAHKAGFFERGGTMTLLARRAATHTATESFNKVPPRLDASGIKRLFGEPAADGSDYRQFINRILDYYEKPENGGFADWLTAKALRDVLPDIIKGKPGIGPATVVDSVMTARSVGVCMEVAGVLDDLIQAGKLTIKQGEIDTASVADGSARLALKNVQEGQPTVLHANALLFALTPSVKVSSHPLLRRMQQDGLVRAEANGFGLMVEPDGEVKPGAGIYYIGPGALTASVARGNFGAWHANVPMLRGEAKKLAMAVLNRLGL